MRWQLATFLILAAIGAQLSSAHAEEAAEPELRRSEGLHPIFVPVVVPVAFVIPGTGHFLRGEHETSLKLLKRAGISLGALVGLSAVVATTGAASTVMIPAIPLLLVAGSSFMSAGSMDIVGAFSGEEMPLAPPRLGRSLEVSYLLVQSEIFESPHYLRASLDVKSPTGEVSGAITSDSRGRNFFFEAGYGLPLGEWSSVRLDGLHERNPESLYTASRLQSSIWGRLPLSRIYPTMKSAMLELGVGYQFRWTHYSTLLNAPDDFMTGISGGFRIHWQAHESFRLNWGYEHSRDGLIGGIGMGYFGHFQLGAGVRVAQNSWINAQAYFGSPLSYQLGWETKW